MTPVTGLQESLVHGLPSSTGELVPTQTPAEHWSLTVHPLPSEHEVPFATGICTGSPDASHESVVHGFPSSILGPVPATQVPVALQVSVPLHALPSEHDVPVATGVWNTPVALHPSVVHGLPSDVCTGAPPHAPDVHWSLVVHASPSEHEVPSAAGVCWAPFEGLQVSAVQGLPSLTSMGVPAVQVPEALQASAPLQRLVSSQEVPVGNGAWVTPATGSQESLVHGLPSVVGTGLPTQVPEVH
jgi:hypothetical protein